MITPSLPTHSEAVLDKGFLLKTPWRTWANAVTVAIKELQSATGIAPATNDPLALTITGTGWITVTGSVESGNFNVTQREGLTTANLPEGSNYYANHSAGTFNFTTDANVTLTTDEYRNAFLEVTDTGPVLTTGRDLVFPAAFPVLLFKNSTAQILTLKKSGQTGVTVAAGAKAVIAPGPTDVEKA